MTKTMKQTSRKGRTSDAMSNTPCDREMARNDFSDKKKKDREAGWRGPDRRGLEGGLAVIINRFLTLSQ